MKRVQLIAIPMALIVSLFLLSVKGNTYLIHFSVWMIAFVVMALGPQARWRRIVFLNLAMASFVFLVFEGALTVKERLAQGNSPNVAKQLPKELHGRHPVLGAAPEPNGRYAAASTRGEEVLYSVHYTIDDNGYRITPPPKNSDAPAILFTGCSFTFGEGLEDPESYPYRVAEKLKNQFRICNLAFSGYGPHQTLASLQEGYYRRTLGDSKPIAVVHLALPDHPNRAVGALSWGQRAPRFSLKDDGTFERTGTFADSASTMQWLRYVRLKEARKSSIGRKILNYQTTDQDVDVWVKLLQACRQEVQKQYTDTQFYVVFLNTPGASTTKMEKALSESDLDYHLMLPELSELMEEKYQIPVDRHPNALGADTIANYMISTVLAPLLR